MQNTPPPPELVSALVDRTGCSRDDAHQALYIAHHDFEAAELHLQRTRPVYLMLVATIEEVGKSSTTEGLLVLFYDRKQPRPRYVQILLTTASVGSVAGAEAKTPIDWAPIAKQFGDKLSGYDRSVSRHLEDALRRLPFPGTIDSYFGAPKLSLASTDGEVEATFLTDALTSSLETTLEECLSFPFRLRLCWQSLTIPMCASIASRTGWQLPILEAVRATDKREVQVLERLNATFRALPLVDAPGQVTLNSVRAGDYIALQILDESPADLRIAEELGLKHGHHWYPAWVEVLESTAGLNGIVHLKAALCPQLEVETSAPGMIRVACRVHDRSQPPRQMTRMGLQAGFLLPMATLILGGVLGMTLLWKP